MKVIIFDDDSNSRDSIKYSLEQDDYKVYIASDIDEEAKNILSGKYDIMITESELGNKNALSLIQFIRAKSPIPIIVISNNTDDITKILAIEYGADDYIIKPFNILELKVRLKAIMRRVNAAKNSNADVEIRFDDFVVKPVGRVLIKGDDIVNLTGKEFDLLYVLSSNPGMIFTREDLMTKVWGYQYYGDVRSIDVHIRRIREKIEPDPKNPKYLMTKWGSGYFFYNYKTNE